MYSGQYRVSGTKTKLKVMLRVSRREIFPLFDGFVLPLGFGVGGPLSPDDGVEWWNTFHTVVHTLNISAISPPINYESPGDERD